MDQEITFQFTPEQIEALQRCAEAIEKVWDALLELAKAFLEAVRKAFEPLARYLTMLRLLEWRLPYRLADFLSQKIPAWLAYDIGLRWFYAKVQALE